MNDLELLMKKVFRSALFFLSVCFLVWAFMPEWRTYAAGMVLGTIISLVNARILAHKIQVITTAILNNTGERVSMGFMARTCMTLIAVMMAMKLPQFALVTTITGVFYVQAVSIGLGYVSIFQHIKSSDEKR
jgi:ATP synthase protein I